MASESQINHIDTWTHITPSVPVRSFRQCRNQILATAIVTIGSFGTGTVFGWSAVACDDLINSGDFGKLSKQEISWVTSLAILGAFTVGPFAGISMDKFGRKKSIALFSIPFMLGWALMSSAFFLKPNGFYLLYIGRVLTGLCAGSNLVIIPTYIKEITSDSMRGILGSAMPLTLCLGILYTFIIGTYLNWAVLSVVCGFAPVLQAILILIVPETPRYLMTQNRRSDAINSYKWLNRSGTYELAEEEFETVCSSTSSSHQVITNRWRKLMTRPVACPIIIILWVVFFQQLGGVNTVTLYTIQIFRDTGDFIKPHAATIIMGVVQVLSVLASMFLVDILGRRTLIVSCSLIMCVSLAGLGFFFFLKEKGDNSERAIHWLPVFTILIYIAAYSCGVGSVPWLLASEIYNPEFRAESSTIMTSSYWIFGFVVAKSYERLKSVLKDSGTFWLYGAFCLGGAIFSALFVPETKGKSSEDILRHFGGATDPVNKNICDDPGHIISASHVKSSQVLEPSSDIFSETELKNPDGKEKTSTINI